MKERTNREYVAAGLYGDEYNYLNGRLTQVTTAQPQNWSIEYTYTTSDLEYGRLSKIEVKDASSQVIKKAEYIYAGESSAYSSDLGSLGDLVQVKVSELSSDNTTWKVRTTQYRYYNSSSTNGKNHQLKMVLESDAIEQINNAGNSAVDTPEELLTQSDTYVVTGSTQLAAYASRSFTYYTSNEDTSSALTTPWGSQTLSSLYGGTNLNEYDSMAYGRVKTEVVNGSCSSCSGGSGDSLKYTYYYMNQNGGTSTDPTQVNTITVEDVQDATGTPLYRNLYGLNHKHQELRQAKIEDPTAGTLKAWCTSTILNSNYNITQKRSPAAHTLIDSNTELIQFLDPTTSTNDADTLNTSEGLIQVFEYDGNNNQTGALVKKGSSGTAYYVSAMDYGNGTTVPTYLATASYRYPAQTTTRASGIATTYAYTFWDTGMQQVQKRTTTQAAVDSTENGPGVSAVTEDYYDRLGRLRWTKDALGYVNYYSYQPDTGGLAYQALDVNPSSMPSSSSGNDTKWVSAGDDGSGSSYGSGGIPTRTGAISTLRTMVTTNEYDSQGRRTKTVEPGSRTHYTIYQPNRTLMFPHWSGSSSALPISASVTNDAGQLLESYSVRATYTSISTSSGAPTGFSSEPSQSDYVAWTRYGYENFTNRLSQVDRYHDIPSSGTGTLSTNFDRSINKYDNHGRLSYAVQTASGTSHSNGKEQVTQRVYDVLDRVIETKTGVSSSSHDMGSSYTTLPTMVTTGKTIYDEGGVGNSYVTRTSRKSAWGASDIYGVNYKRTYRGHLRAAENFRMQSTTEIPQSPYEVSDLDWEGKTTAVGRFNPNPPNWSTVLTGDGYTDYAAVTSSPQGALVQTLYDDLGRSYRTLRHSVDVNGILVGALQTDMYYDLAGQLVASGSPHGTFTETAYDALGRAYQSRRVFELESTKYSSGTFQYRDPQPNPGFSSSNTSAMTGGDDKVINLSHSVYDDIGNMTESHSFVGYHGDTDGIDLSATDDYIRSSSYSWYDDLDRLTTSGEYGSGDTTAGAGTWKYAAVPSRPSTAPTASSETVLVSKYSYETTTGRSSVMTSPKGRPTKSFYDDFGRTTFVAENFDNFDPSSLSSVSDGSDASKDRVTQTTYDGLGNTTTLIAYNGSSSDTQTTKYLYEDAINARWMTNTIYPDSSDTTSSGTDQVKMTYYPDGRLFTKVDQRGVQITYYYDGLRRNTVQRVEDLGDSGQNVDGTVLSISKAYHPTGNPAYATSHGNEVLLPTDNTNIKNQIGFNQDGLGQLRYDYQNHSGAVNTSTTPKSEIIYDTTVASGLFTNNARQRFLVYPNGRILYYDYSTTYCDLTNSPYTLRETNSSGTIWARYNYAADGLSVRTGYPGPVLQMDLHQSNTNTLNGLDRFGRIKNLWWYNFTGAIDSRARFNYAYDDDSNRLSAEDVLAATNSKNYDELYAYDGLDRLTNTQRGNLSSGSIASKNYEETFDLDQLNNWAAYYRDLNGDGTDDLVQTRGHNDVNEITGISASVGTTWATPTYDAAGNMVTCPKPNDPANSFTLRWDAWNRLVKVLDGANTVVEYEYDGMNRRVVKKLYSSGSLVQTRHRYHAPGQDQVIEERVDSSTTAERQFTWGVRYIDDLVMRTRDTDANGSLDETLYALTDITYDVVALADATGAVVERFLYDPYGKSTVLDANFALDGDGASDYDWEYRFTSREFDKETGLDYFRGRYWITPLGRFVNRDPIGYPDGMNAYAGYFVPSGVDPLGSAEVELKLSPEKPDGVGYYVYRFTALPVFGAVTAYKATVECSCEKCEGADCYKLSKCTVSLTQTILMEERVYKAWLLTEKGRKRRLGVYGHEQRHIQNGINSAKEIKESLENYLSLSTCEDKEKCDKTAKETADRYYKLFINKLNIDADHMNKEPENGKEYSTIGDMPANPSENLPEWVKDWINDYEKRNQK